MTPDTTRWAYPMEADQFPFVDLEDAANDNDWLLAVVAPRAEFKAVKALRELGIACYLPCETRWQILAGQRVAVKRPLFPRYLFVGFSVSREGGYVGMHLARTADGIEAFMKRDGRACVVPHKVLAEVAKKEKGGRYDHTLDKTAARAEAQKVRMSFADFQTLSRDVVLDAVEKGQIEPVVEMLRAA